MKFYKFCVFLIASMHVILMFANFTAFCILPFCVKWYISTPLCSVIVWMMFARGDRCPLTTLENLMRRKAKMPQIRGFIGHYILQR